MIATRCKTSLLLFAVVLTGCSKPGPPVRTGLEVESLLKTDWQEIMRKYPLNKKDHDATVWTSRISPPLPAQWPPGPDRKVVYYAYPEGMMLHGGDSLMIGKPWARVISVSSSQSNIRILRHSISKLETQGFRPLSNYEVAVMRSSTTGPARLMDLDTVPLTGSDDTRVVRDYYCSWLGGNGIIASKLQSSHSGFFTWLDCSSWKPVPITVRD